MKPYIDEMMEIPIIKAISICESIAGVICILPRLPKVIDRLTGHQIPALAHELDDGFHSGHNGGHAGGHGLSMKSFLLSQKVMVAGPGIEPGSPDSYSGVLPMH